MISEALKAHKFIIFGNEHYNPLGIVRSLGEEGILPVVVVIRNHIKVLSSSKYCGELYYVDSIEEGYTLIVNKLIGKNNDKTEKSFILTSDDSITSYFDQKYDEIKDKLFFYNAGGQSRITQAMEKRFLCELAKKHGLNIPKTYLVKIGEIPEGIEYPVLTKADDSFAQNWKAATHICENEGQLKEAFACIQQDRILIQNYIKKKNELCLDGYAWNHGKNIFISIASNYKYILSDRYSHYMDVFNFNNRKLQEALEGMFLEIGFEGIFSVEFLIDQQDDLYFLEINFRNSTWSYISTKVGMNLVTGWCSAMLEGESHVPAYREIPDGYTAMVEISDFTTRVLGKMISIGQWIKEIKNCDCLLYFNKEDSKPFWTAITSKLMAKVL